MNKGYANLKLIKDSKSTDMLYKLLNLTKIQNVIDDFHITLMYDKSNPDIEFNVDPNKEYVATVSDIKLLGEPGTKWYSIAFTLTSPEIVERHKDYIKAGFKHSYPNFIPHMSIKYQPTNKDISVLNDKFNLFKGLYLYFNSEQLEHIKE
jgi:hypothetical protein